MKRITSSTFLRHNAIFFVGSVGVGVLNYAYYPILGRLLTPAAFGEVQALVSLFLQLTIFLTVLSLITVNIVVNYKDKLLMRSVLFELEKTALFIGIGLLILTAIFGEALQKFLQFDSPLPFVVAALAFVVSIPLVFRGAYVRGKKAFGKASFINLAASAIKILLSAALVVLGLSTIGAMLGIVAAQFTAFLLAAWWAHQLGLTKPAGRYLRLPKLRVIGSELKYAGLVLVGSLVITLLYSIDIIVAKHYFDAHTAGLYAGIATVARIVFFLTASIVQVMLPGVKLEQPSSQNRALLQKSLVLMTAISLPVLGVFVLLPDMVVRLLMGGEYVLYASLLPLLSVVIFTISVLNLIINYFVALRRYTIAIVGIIVAVVASLAMVFHHQNPKEIVESLLFTSVIAICLCGIWVAIDHINQRRKREETRRSHHNNRTGL